MKVAVAYVFAVIVFIIIPMVGLILTMPKKGDKNAE